ncbi:MAG: RidA family protein [Chloroflexi bacterium]|nr:RidA family protein [Chloroflexota bacterium]
MPKQSIDPPNTPPSPLYSQAIKVGNMIFISGQVARDKDNPVVGKGDIVAQAEKVYENMGEVLKAAGATFKDVVKMTTYMVNPEDMGKIREVRTRYFGNHRPAATGLVVKRLAHPDFLMEMEAIAVIE